MPAPSQAPGSMSSMWSRYRTDHPLLSTPRTVLSPHTGFVSQRSLRTAYAGAVEDILAWMAGAPIRVLNAPDS